MNEHLELEDQIVPGMSILRRRMLWLPALTAAGLIIGRTWEVDAKDTDKVASDIMRVSRASWDGRTFLRNAFPLQRSLPQGFIRTRAKRLPLLDRIEGC